MTSRRRGAVAALLSVLLLGAVGACGADVSARPVTVLGSWTVAEEQSFRSLLTAFSNRTGIPVEYHGTRAVDRVLTDDVLAGAPPDVVILPSAGELARYTRTARDGSAVSLQPIDGLPTSEVPADWQQITHLGTDHTVAVPVKADLKGIVWYPRARFSGAPPATIDALVALGDAARAQDDQAWCLGMTAPPASGWPGTDWIEDVLLHQSGPDAYSALASGRADWRSDEVRQAFRTWGSLIGTDAGTTNRALFTDFQDAAAGMFGEPADRPGVPTCRFEHQASFGIPLLESGTGHPRPGVDFDWFPFPPAVAGTTVPTLVSTDLAATFTGTPEARKLLAFLAGGEAQGLWAHEAGSFSMSPAVSDVAFPDEPSRAIERALTGADATGGRAGVCLDASDTMPAAMSSAFERAVLEFLARPARLDEILDELNAVQKSISPDEWLPLVCGTTTRR